MFPFRSAILSAALMVGPVALADDFSRLVQPILEEHCYRCHGPTRQRGGIEVHGLVSTESAFRHHRFLETIAHEIETGAMPPAEDVRRLPSDEERETAVREIRQVLTRLQSASFPPNPGRPTIRRLNRHEYSHTVRDLFGVPFAAGADFPADGAGGEGFDNVGDALFLPPILMEKYLAASRRVIEALYSNPAALQRTLVARPNEGTEPRAAATTTLQYHATLAFRRRVTEEDTASMLALFERNLEAGMDYEEAIRAPLQSLLVHPSFLFRMEEDPPDQPHWQIPPFELATRLSYFLWASMPDRELFLAADQGRLADPAELRRQVDRMLDDPRSITLARHFGGQWLGYEELIEVAEPDPNRFPTFTPALRQAMYRESVEFFHHLLRENRPLTELIHADYTFLNADLADHYGIPGVRGREMRQVPLDDPHRGGVIGQASVLTVTSVPLRTSPVRRGAWILDKLLGTPPPPPPPDAGELPADDASSEGLSFRQQLEMHRERPSCAGCHERIDPLGFGLENFDAIGRWREVDFNGQPVDSLAILPGDIRFSTPAELKQLLLQSDDLFLRNASRKMLAYALGRPLEYYDEPVVTELVEELRANGLQSRALVHAIARSFPFQHRSAER